MKNLFIALIFFMLMLAIPWQGLNALAASGSGLDDESSLEFMDFLSLTEESLGKVRMKGEFLDGDLLKISVLVEDMQSPVLGMAFNLSYEDSKLAFLRYEPGTFLERGGDPFYLVSQNQAKDQLVFGETLRRDDSFPLGEGLIADFYFQIIEESTYSFEFDRATVSTLDTVRQDLDKVEWENLLLNREHPEGLKEGVQAGGSGGFGFGNLSIGAGFKMALSGSLALFIGAYTFWFLRKRLDKRHR